MRAVNRIALVLGLAGILAACGPMRGPQSALPQMTLGMRFGLENLCSGSQSPPIRIVDVPEATTAYRIRITNVSVLIQSPREWTIPAPGEKELVPFGALDNWTGPCPGDLQRYRYRVEVLALDGGGSPVAYGLTEDTVDSVNEQAQRMWRRGAAGPQFDPTVPPDPRADQATERIEIFPRDRDGGLFDERTPRGLPVPVPDPLAPGSVRR